MTTKDLFDIIVNRFLALREVQELIKDPVIISANSMSMDEALLIKDRRDFPNLSGKEVMIDAEFNGCHGQAYTDAPSEWSGCLEDFLDMDYENDPHARGLLIASINAVMGSFGMCDRMIHCREDGPKKCSCKLVPELMESYADKKILLVGFQPFITSKLSESGSNFRVLDLNPDCIGKVHYGALINDGADRKFMAECIEWADLILCTGSTVCNGTLVDFLDTGKETLFYGTTIAGTAALLGLKRICFADEV